jgi:hypothetical protein
VLLGAHSVVVYIQLVVAAAAVVAPVVAVFDAAAAAAAEMDVCAVAGECVHAAQAGAYAEVSGMSVRKRVQSNGNVLLTRIALKSSSRPNPSTPEILGAAGNPTYFAMPLRTLTS